MAHAELWPLITDKESNKEVGKVSQQYCDAGIQEKYILVAINDLLVVVVGYLVLAAVCKR